MEEEEEFALSPILAADSDSLSSHSTVVMLRRTRTRASKTNPASVMMLEGSAAASAASAASASSSKWRLPLLCLLLTALAVAVVAPAVAAFSRHDRDTRSSAVNNAAPVSDSGKPAAILHFRHSKALMRIGAVTCDFSIPPWPWGLMHFQILLAARFIVT